MIPSTEWSSDNQVDAGKAEGTTIALFSDIHSNIDAFEAVMDDAARLNVTRWYGLGDIVGYGPEPGECVRIARKKFHRCVVGNHEAMLRYSTPNQDSDEEWGSVAQPLKIALRQLGDSEDMAWLRRLPVVIKESGMMLVHSSPYRPGSFAYIHNKEDAKASFGCQEAGLVFYGHTHVPAIWEMRGRRIRCSIPGENWIRLEPGTRYMINVGSVGQPRDGDPRACYVIYDPEKRAVRFRRIPYDIKAAQARFYAANLPARNSLRLALGE